MPLLRSILLLMSFAPVVVAQATQPAREEFVIELRGIVTDRAGKPMAGAEVEAFTGGRNYEPPRQFTKLGQTVADAEGRFVLKDLRKPTEGSPHYVRAGAPGMAYGYDSGPILNIHTGESRAFESDEARIVLRPAATIRGRVVDEEGTPVPGASFASDFPIDSVQTNERGEFTIERCNPIVDDLGPGRSPRSLMVLHADFVADWFQQPRYLDEVVLKVRRGKLITGRITDAGTGAPISDGAVTALREGGQPIKSYGYCEPDGRYRMRIPTDIGSIELAAVVQTSRAGDRTYQPTVRTHRITTDTNDAVEADFTFTSTPIKRKPPAPRADYQTPAWAGEKLAGIKGKVLDQHGKPVPLARIEVIDMTTRFEMNQPPGVARKSIHDSAIADLSGNFVCDQIDPAQPLLVIAWDPAGEWMRQLVTDPGTESVEIRLTERAAKLTGVVHDGDGQPEAGIPISLTLTRDEQPNIIFTLSHSVSDAQGRYEIAGYHAPPEGTSVRLQVDSPHHDWSDGEDRRIVEHGRYVYFPVEPGQILDGLDYDLVQGVPRIAAPMREEFTRKP